MNTINIADGTADPKSLRIKQGDEVKLFASIALDGTPGEDILFELMDSTKRDETGQPLFLAALDAGIALLDEIQATNKVVFVDKLSEEYIAVSGDYDVIYIEPQDNPIQFIEDTLLAYHARTIEEVHIVASGFQGVINLGGNPIVLADLPSSLWDPLRDYLKYTPSSQFNFYCPLIADDPGSKLKLYDWAKELDIPFSATSNLDIELLTFTTDDDKTPANPITSLDPRPATLVVNSTEDSGVGTLRWAIDNHQPLVTRVLVDVDAVELESELQVTKDLSIEKYPGANLGIVLTTVGGSRAFIVDGANLHITDVTLFGFEAISHDSTYSVENGVGGAILVVNGGTLTSVNSVFQQNTAEMSGGAIYTDTSSALHLVGNTILDNTVTSEDIPALGDYPGGGGIYSEGTSVFIKKCSIKNNTASTFGGGMILGSANCEVTESTIENNHSVRGVGGIAVLDGHSVITRSTIARNSSDGDAGGLSIGYPATGYIKHNTIAYNMANADDSFGTGEMAGGLLIQGYIDQDIDPDPEVDLDSMTTIAHNLMVENRVGTSDLVMDFTVSDYRGTVDIPSVNVVTDFTVSPFNTLKSIPIWHVNGVHKYLDIDPIFEDDMLTSDYDSTGILRTTAEFVSVTEVLEREDTYNIDQDQLGRYVSEDSLVQAIDVGSYEYNSSATPLGYVPPVLEEEEEEITIPEDTDTEDTVVDPRTIAPILVEGPRDTLCITIPSDITEGLEEGSYLYSMSRNDTLKKTHEFIVSGYINVSMH